MSAREECLENLIVISKDKGYLTFEDVMDASEKFDLVIEDFDSLTEELSMRNIIIYEEDAVPQNVNIESSYEDFSQQNYSIIYDEIVRIAPNLAPLIEDIRATPSPKYCEVKRLVNQRLEGNEYARDRLIQSHMRIAVKIALRMSKRHGFDLEDAVSAALLGLIDGVDHYSMNSFSAFQSYASFWIMQKINRYCKPTWIEYYYSAHMLEQLLPAVGIFDEHDCPNCAREYCFDLAEQVASTLKCKHKGAERLIKDIRQQKNGRRDITTIETEILAHRKEETVYRVYPESLIAKENAEDRVVREECIRKLWEILGDLKDRERQIIILRFGLIDNQPRTMEEVGRKFNVERERIRQIEAKALRKLRNPVRSQLLKDFL